MLHVSFTPNSKGKINIWIILTWIFETVFMTLLLNLNPRGLCTYGKPQYSQLWDLRERFIYFQGGVEKLQSTSQPQLIVSEASIYRTWSIHTIRLFRWRLEYTVRFHLTK